MRIRRFLTRDAGAVSIDWTLVVVGLVALGLASGAFVRSTGGGLGASPAARLSGVEALAPGDQLVAVEDFEAGSAGWYAGRVEASDPGFGGMLGRYGGTDGTEAVSRRYMLTDEASHVMISFDLHAIDDWQLEEVIIFLEGAEIARRSFTTRPEMMAGQRLTVAGTEGLRVETEAQNLQRRDRGYASQSPQDEDQTLRVRIIAEVPGNGISLGFGSTLNRTPVDASWAVDNIRVIATDNPPV